METKKAPLIVSGTAQMIEQGTKALEALPALVERLSGSKRVWVEEGVAEFTISENEAITASISVSFDDGTLMGFDDWFWNGEAWDSHGHTGFGA